MCGCMCVCGFKVAVSYVRNQTKLNAVDKWDSQQSKWCDVFGFICHSVCSFAEPEESKYLHSFVHCPSTHCCLQQVNKILLMLITFFMAVPDLIPYFSKKLSSFMINFKTNLFEAGFVEVMMYFPSDLILYSCQGSSQSIRMNSNHWS